jgi:hypothetical protein
MEKREMNVTVIDPPATLDESQFGTPDCITTARRCSVSLHRFDDNRIQPCSHVLFPVLGEVKRSRCIDSGAGMYRTESLGPVPHPKSLCFVVTLRSIMSLNALEPRYSKLNTRG